MVAFRIHKRERCQLCGTAEWEWDPAQGGNKFAYEPTVHVCTGCAKKEIMQSEDEGKVPGGTIILTPTKTVAWAKSMLQRQRRQRRRANA